MKKTSLYRVVHIASGKDYVGISVRPKQRWNEHMRLSKAPKTPFHCALKAHGREAFTWNVISWCWSFQAAQLLERVARHLGLGSYNLTLGGEGTLGSKRSTEQRARIGAKSVGRHQAGRKKFTDEEREVARQRMLGRKPSAETRSKMSASRMGNKNKLGKKESEETRLKKRQAALRRHQL